MRNFFVLSAFQAVLFLSLVGCSEKHPGVGNRTGKPVKAPTKAEAEPEPDLSHIQKSFAEIGMDVEAQVKATEADLYNYKDIKQHVEKIDALAERLASHKGALTADAATRLKAEVEQAEKQMQLGLFRVYGSKVIEDIRDIESRVINMTDLILPKKDELAELLGEDSKSSAEERKLRRQIRFTKLLLESGELMDEVENIVSLRNFEGRLYIPQNNKSFTPTSFDLGGKRDVNLTALMNKANANDSLSVLYHFKISIENLHYHSTLKDLKISPLLQGPDNDNTVKILNDLRKRISSLLGTLAIKKPIEKINQLEDVLTE